MTITKEQAVELGKQIATSAYTNRHYLDKTVYTFNLDALHALCNAAIEHYTAQQAAPTHVWAATSKTMQVLFATEADARKMQPTATSPFDVQRVPVFGAQAAPTKE